MSIWSSLFSGSSGLDAFGQAIGVVSDNIANVSTVGFKNSKASFADVLGGMASNGQRSGNGVMMSGPEVQFGQGSIQQTGRSLDLALQGDGFFVMKGALGGATGDYFSRDGRFSVSKDGFLEGMSGLKVQGFNIDQAGNVGTVAEDILISGEVSPVPTTAVSMSLNLDAEATPLVDAFDPANPKATSNYTTSVTVYDSLGKAHDVEVHFRAQGAGAWEWRATVDGASIEGGASGESTEVAGGSLLFLPDGSLDVESPDATTIDFRDATAGQAIAFDFGDAVSTDEGTGRAGITQNAAPSEMRSLEQNGYAAGSLLDVEISQTGDLRAVYSNGEQRDVARLAIANFSAESELQRAGSGMFAATKESGTPSIGEAGNGGRASLSAGAIEGSNVDLGAELVTLIAYQRAFQANARTVSTADEMLTETANLKR